MLFDYAWLFFKLIIYVYLFSIFYFAFCHVWFICDFFSFFVYLIVIFSFLV